MLLQIKATFLSAYFKAYEKLSNKTKRFLGQIIWKMLHYLSAGKSMQISKMKTEEVCNKEICSPN